MIFNNQDIKLHGWVLDPERSRAIIYFGGNSEVIQNNILEFEEIFADYSVYLIHYRGYGKNDGTPSETALFSDALALYDQIQPLYESVSLMGRSLGSGVAVYLASKRDTGKLILLTPYDSIPEVAQVHYPFVPSRQVPRDRFESFRYAPQITAPVLMVTAALDRMVPVTRALKLREYLTNTQVTYRMIKAAAHNDVTEFAEYRRLLREFVTAEAD